MKKMIGIGIAVVGLYFVAVLVQAELSERKAEKHLESLLSEISSPWSAEQIRHHCSDCLCTRAKLTPEEIVRLAEQDLGSLQEIIEGPECIFQEGYERNRPDKRIVWAMCDVEARFEKKTATLKIRLVEEPSHPPKLFGILGESLRLNDFISIDYQGAISWQK